MACQRRVKLGVHDGRDVLGAEKGLLPHLLGAGNCLQVLDRCRMHHSVVNGVLVVVKRQKEGVQVQQLVRSGQMSLPPPVSHKLADFESQR